MKSLHLGFVFAALLAGPVRSQGSVLVVNSAGGAPYTQIQAAVNAATNGDVLLVKAGTYSGFNLTKRVTVIADDGEGVHVDGTAIVNNMSAGEAVLLHRLRIFGISGPTGDDGPGLTAHTNAGPLRLQNCFLQGALGCIGADVIGCAQLALYDSIVAGGNAANSGSSLSGGVGMKFSGTNVALATCDVRGGSGVSGPFGVQPPACSGSHGAAGFLASANGFVFAGATLFRGGNGGVGGNGCYPGTGFGDCCFGGNGGNALDVFTGAQTLWQLDNVKQWGQGGYGGFGMCGCGFTAQCECDPGVNGIAQRTSTNDTLVTLAGSFPVLDASPNPVRELNTLVIKIHTTPGDQVYLLYSRQPAFAPESGRGVRLVNLATPPRYQILGPANGSGLAQDGWNVPDLGAGVQSQLVHVQALVLHTNGQMVWSNALEVVLLDSAF